ncbi:MAG: lysophospholipid acyltransferase family protein [Actinomycetota bacterium]|nr:lysophospholipid acyltransferase family protein [Actinomycetota bacterium]
MEHIKVGEYEIRLTPSIVDRYFYGFARGVVDFINRSYFQVRVVGKENIPSAPFILAPTHRSNLDTLMMGSVYRRRLRYMGKDSLWKKKFAGEVLAALGGFPVARGTADREALNACVAVLKAGQPLVLFPEGMRREGDKVEDILDGAAYIGLKTGVPIVPIGIAGSDRAMGKGVKFPLPKRCVVVIKPPISTLIDGQVGSKVPRSKVNEVTDSLTRALQEAYDEAKFRL